VVYPKHLATLISDEHCHTLASRSSSPSTPPNPNSAAEHESWKRPEKHQRHQTHTEIRDETYSVNTDNSPDTNDEDLRPAKRRKPRSAPTVTTPLHLRRSPRLGSPSTTRLEIDEAQPQENHGYLSTFVDDEQHSASRTSPSPPTATEVVPFAEYQEWSFQGFLKRTKIGGDVTYNLEFKLPSTSKYLHLPINPKALDICSSKDPMAKIPINHNTAAHSKIRQARLQPKKRSILPRKESKELTKEQERLLANMVHKDKTWTEIRRHFPGYPLRSLKENYFTKQGGQPRKRGRKPGVRVRST